MNELFIKKNLVSVNWLQEHIKDPNLVILDATIPKVVVKNHEGPQSSSTQIDHALYMDLKNSFSDLTAEFPNTMLSVDQFTKAAGDLGINKNSAIVVYDDFGIYSSPRAWWIFRAMGHHNIAVLDGGLPEWIQAGFAIRQREAVQVRQGNFRAKYNANFFQNYQDISDAIANGNSLILDARSDERFHGLVEEPRKGLRSGHIPASQNLPYSSLLMGNKMKDKNSLRDEFQGLYKHDKPLVFTCGSGITACILALGADLTGIESTAVYDGSWTEWGSLLKLPIEK